MYTDGERAASRLQSLGRDNAAIARALGVTERHVRRILRSRDAKRREIVRLTQRILAGHSVEEIDAELLAA